MIVSVIMRVVSADQSEMQDNKKRLSVVHEVENNFYFTKT